MYTSLSIPCSSLIFTPPESMTEVMTKRGVKLYPEEREFHPEGSQNHRFWRPKRSQNRPREVSKASFKTKSFLKLGFVHVGPPGGGNFINMRFEINTNIAALWKTAWEAIWTPAGGFWPRFCTRKGSIFDLRAWSAHCGGNTIFRGSRGPKMDQHGGQNGFQRQPGSKSVLEGSWARFWLDFGFHFGV